MKHQITKIVLLALIALSSCERQEKPGQPSKLKELNRSLIQLPNARAIAPVVLAGGSNGQVEVGGMNEGWTLLSLGYMSCPDVCPTTLGAVGKALSILNAEDGQASTKGLFVSVDVSRDKPAALEAYAQFFHPDLHGATGTKSAVDGLVASLDASYRIPSKRSGVYPVDHSTAVFLVDPWGRWAGTLPHPKGPQQIVDDLRTLRGPVGVSDLVVRLAPPGAPATAGFLKLSNHSSQKQAVLRASSSAFGRIEFHRTEVSQGVARMAKEASVPVAAHGETLLKSGGRHLMLFEPQYQLKAGERIPFEFELASGQVVLTQATVTSL